MFFFLKGQSNKCFGPLPFWTDPLSVDTCTTHRNVTKQGTGLHGEPHRVRRPLGVCGPDTRGGHEVRHHSR